LSWSSSPCLPAKDKDKDKNKVKNKGNDKDNKDKNKDKNKGNCKAKDKDQDSILTLHSFSERAHDKEKRPRRDLNDNEIYR
jgi:hypothetical protein